MPSAAACLSPASRSLRARVRASPVDCVSRILWRTNRGASRRELDQAAGRCTSELSELASGRATSRSCFVGMCTVLAIAPAMRTRTTLHIVSLVIALLGARTAWAQLAPTGDHYAARTAD